jgi:ring-1,2-phenylacetyl-CoA epoxidase subunit PaaE
MTPARRVTSVDVLASAMHRVAPAALGRVIDQARLDLNSLASEAWGEREPSFSTPSRPPVEATEIADVDPLFHMLPSGLRPSYTLLRGDLSMLVSELRGERTSPVVPRPPSRLDRARLDRARLDRARAEPSRELTPRALEVVSLALETEDALSIGLRADGPFSFVPGQFLTLHVPIEGLVHKRAYSISSAPTDAHPTITVKRIAGGKVSGHLHAAFRAGTLALGSRLSVLGPSGHFVAAPASVPRHLVFFAGGSGITPIASIVTSVLASEPGTRVTLIYGSRSEREIIFRARLAELSSAYPDRLRVEHGLEASDGSIAARVGRPDAALLEALWDALALGVRLPGEAPSEHFVCGPRPMMDAVRTCLLAHGVAKTAIHEERFQSPGTSLSSALPDVPVTVTLKKRGLSQPFSVPPQKTVLEAALAAGVAMPFSCAMGGCAACKCTVVSGEMQMDEPNCLTDEEKAAHQVLTCVGRPMGDVTLEVP